MQALNQIVQQFSAKMERQFAKEIGRDPAGFKKQVIRLIRRELPPKPGRPNDPRLVASVRIVREGKSVKDVLQSQIPGFDNMDTYGRYLAEKGLRAAIARRRRMISRPGKPRNQTVNLNPAS